jgi:eukaryotic-like serine/threonine-protein kinase
VNESEIFTNALKLTTPAERAAYLQGACAGNPPLRAALEALLHAHASDPGFLEQPAMPLRATADSAPPNVPANETTAAAPTEQPGIVIGPYKLLQEIGEGGMGTVWMAEQTQPVQRKVALKIIKAGMDSRHVLARFEAERQALALMDHPHIAKVLDAGATREGRPYFVMELVKGQPITQYCDAHRLTPKERLELFVPVCQAIQHAHQKGIIHRDIKPSNVLVAPYDGKPVVKVIDFGVAKATGPKLTDKTLFTEFGAVIGTLEYMSPEQAELNNQDIDTRSDIYALGVLLYELLTGTTPLDRKRLKQVSFVELLRHIREDEPPKPSTRLSESHDTLASISAQRQMEPAKLTRMMRGELDWIVMKALEKERTRRYETASGLAQDVQRYLADELVEARPPSAGYRLRKFARRNRAVLATAAAMILLLLAGVAASLWQAQKARAAAKAEKQANTETQAVLDFVEKQIFAAALPEGQEGGLGRDVTLRRAIEAALRHVDESFRDQPLIEARLRMTLGISFHYLGEEKIAVEQLQTARTIYTLHRGPNHADTLTSMHHLADSYSGGDRHAEAVQLFEETLALRKETLGAVHPDTLLTSVGLGCAYRDLGRIYDAEKVLEETQKLLEDTLGPDHPHTLSNMTGLSLAYVLHRRYGEALELAKKALDRRKAKHGPNDPRTLDAMDAVAVIQQGLGQYEDSIALLKEASSLHEKVLGPGHPSTPWIKDHLALSYYLAGREADALRVYEDLLARWEQSGRPADKRAFVIDFAEFLATASDDSVRDPKRALQLTQKVKELAPQSCWATRGIARYRNDDFKGAKADLQKEIELLPISQKSGSSDLENRAGAIFFLAMAHWQLGEKEEARTCFEKGMQWVEKRGSDRGHWFPALKRTRAEAAGLLGLENKDRAPGARGGEP